LDIAESAHLGDNVISITIRLRIGKFCLSAGSAAWLAGPTPAGQLPKSLMRNPTAYLKMRVLGAIDLAEGKNIQARIKTVSQMTFTDEDDQPRQFTWRSAIPAPARAF
jgi:hypothetical protein